MHVVLLILFINLCFFVNYLSLLIFLLNLSFLYSQIISNYISNASKLISCMLRYYICIIVKYYLTTSLSCFYASASSSNICLGKHFVLISNQFYLIYWNFSKLQQFSILLIYTVLQSKKRRRA